MSQLLIEVDTPEDEALLLQLLPKLNSRLVGRPIPKSQSDASPIEGLKRTAARGGLSHSGMGLSGSVKLGRIVL